MSTTCYESSSGFACFELAPSLQKGVTAAGFVSPRPIQTQTMPDALAGRDVLGLAQTGTGKTAAFALPILQRILTEGKKGGKKGTRVLIVAPTRELASQIAEEIRMLARYTGIRVATVFGGVSASSQINALRREPEILVACPGRLLDLFRQGHVNLNHVGVLVLDEADHMFDMGFIPDIRRIIAALPSERQNLLFSATIPSEIRGLAEHLLHKPRVVDLNRSRPVETVTHSHYPVDNRQKLGVLRHILALDNPTSTIVFTRTKHRAKQLARRLDQWGHSVTALQGNMSQSQRVRAMEGFRKRNFQILVATDIAARGIDVEQVSHVINFDMPNTADAYTHRIGRTGRAERKGKAITFVTREDSGLLQQVERKLGARIRGESLEGIEFTGPSMEDRGRFRPENRRQTRFKGRHQKRSGRRNSRRNS